MKDIAPEVVSWIISSEAKAAQILRKPGRVLKLDKQIKKVVRYSSK